MEIPEFIISFIFTFIAAGSGAFAGAWGAVIINDRRKNRAELIDEIRNTNLAINMAASIFSSLVTLKKQLVKPLKDDWEKQKTEFLNHVEKIRLRQINQDAKIDIVFNLQNLSLQHLPLDVLQKQIFENLSLIGRPLSLTTTLVGTANTLDIFFEKRNLLIESYKENNNLTPSLYFGLRNEGLINEDYSSTIKNISQLTDDGVFFSNLLCKDLMEYGKETRDQYRKIHGKEAPRVSSFEVLEENLKFIPCDDKYSDWITNFIKLTPT